MRIRSVLASGAVLLAVAGTSVATAGAASATSAHPRPSPVATGSVALSGPIQYVSFVAVPARGHQHARGFIDYANFTYPAVGTNVWNIGGTHQLTFTSGGTAYQHTMTVSTVTPLSTHSTAFTGTGSYNTDPTHYTWTVSGTVSWNVVSFTIKYDPTSANPGYQVTGQGVISATDGSVSGTATDSAGNTLPFTMPASSAFQVLKYTAPVKWASIWGHNASFVFTIPKGTPAGLTGLRIVVKVHDGGPGYAKDTYAHGVATSPHNGPVTQYPITSGNIFVRK
jgi:hypothetical protein